MSTIDLVVRDMLKDYGLVIFLIGCAVFWMAKKWAYFKRNAYRNYLVGFEMECSELALPYKKQILEPMQRIVSNDQVLKSMGCIRVLEIGVKTGENIQFYPEGTHLIGVDWNLKLGEYLVKDNRAWQFSHVIIEHLIVGDGSSMKEVPTGYVDVVVTTRSLCSVASVESTLQEIRRVLAPGGRYFFMEHIPEDEGTFVRWLQKLLTRSGLWPSLFGGCRLDRDPTTEIENAGFDRVSWTRVTLEGYVAQPIHLILSRQHVLGVASR